MSLLSSDEKQEIEQIKRESFLPPAGNKNNWKIVFIILAVIGLSGAIIATVYRVIPPKTQPVRKRTAPASAISFVTILSPVQADFAQKVVQRVVSDIGTDTAMTKINFGGTHSYKESIASIDDFTKLLPGALTGARSESMKNQGLLISQSVGVVMAEKLPSRMYFVGTFTKNTDDNELFVMKNRFEGIAKALVVQNTSRAKLTLITIPPPNETEEEQRLRRELLSVFSQKGIEIQQISL